MMGDGVRDFSEASAPQDIDSSGDESDVRSPLGDIKLFWERRDDNPEKYFFCKQSGDQNTVKYMLSLRSLLF